MSLQTYSGFLHKRGPTRKHGYKLRHFTLQGGYLRYFKKENDPPEKELGHVQLSRVINFWINGGDNEPAKPQLAGLVFSMDVMQDSGIPREYVFCALTDDSKLYWSNCLQEGIAQYRNGRTKGSEISVHTVKQGLHIDEHTKLDDIVATLSAAAPGRTAGETPSLRSRAVTSSSTSTHRAPEAAPPRAVPPRRYTSAVPVSAPSRSLPPSEVVMPPNRRPPPPARPYAPTTNQRPLPAARSAPTPAPRPQPPPRVQPPVAPTRRLPPVVKPPPPEPEPEPEEHYAEEEEYLEEEEAWPEEAIEEEEEWHEEEEAYEDDYEDTRPYDDYEDLTGPLELPDMPAPPPPPAAVAPKPQVVSAYAEMAPEPRSAPMYDDQSSGYEDLTLASGFDNDTEEAPDLDVLGEAEERLACYDFEPEDEDQIAMTAGDKIIVEEIDGEWIFGTNVMTGLNGWMPLNFTAPTN